VTYDFGPGTLSLGSWIHKGLRSYSGAIRMSQTFRLEPPPAANSSVILDLGPVRGTVEALVNGKSAGIRCMSPYRFDIGSLLKSAGDQQLELVVTNTLVNFISTWSPTRTWSPDQLECGVFGPVRILT
jgi:hypothetical protein